MINEFDAKLENVYSKGEKFQNYCTSSSIISIQKKDDRMEEIKQLMFVDSQPKKLLFKIEVNICNYKLHINVCTSSIFTSKELL